MAYWQRRKGGCLLPNLFGDKGCLTGAAGSKKKNST